MINSGISVMSAVEYRKAFEDFCYISVHRLSSVRASQTSASVICYRPTIRSSWALKSPCRTSYLSSMATLYSSTFFGFEKIAFLCTRFKHQANRQTDRQDRQTDRRDRQTDKQID